MERELILGILPADTRKMEKLGETGACRRGRVRGNFLGPRRVGAHARLAVARAQWPLGKPNGGGESVVWN